MEGLVILKNHVYSRLGEYLESNGINKSWVARQIGATKAQMYNWCKNDEEGRALSTPSVLYVLRLEKTLDKPISELFEEVE
jgi:hypothetical protein